MESLGKIGSGRQSKMLDPWCVTSSTVVLPVQTEVSGCTTHAAVLQCEAVLSLTVIPLSTNRRLFCRAQR